MGKRAHAVKAFRWVTPRQARSQSTMDRLLDGAEELLGEHSFEDVSIAMICQAGESHVGSFYNLFKDKLALLECLMERYDRDRVATFTQALERARTTRMTIEQRAAAIVGSGLSIVEQRPGAIRARLYARHHPAITWANAAESEKIVVESITQMFLDCKDRIGHSNPRRAIEFALVANQETANRFCIARHSLPPAAARMSRRALEEAMTSMFLGNLGVRQGPSRAP